MVGDANIKLARDQSIRIPRTTTAQGAGFGDSISDSDREYAVQREPVAFRVTCVVADDVFDKWFEVDDPRTKGQDAELNRKIQKVLRDLQAKTIFQDVLAFERIYGWSIIVVGFDDISSSSELKDELKENSEVVELAVYPKTKVSIEYDKDSTSKRFGQPQFYSIQRGGIGKIRVHYSRVIHVQTRSTGVSVLDPIWDDLTNLRNIRWGMGQTMFRYGGGFPVIGVKGASKAQLQAYAEDGGFSNLMSRTALYIDPNVMTFDFKGVMGTALNPEPYYKPIMENLATGTCIPEAILRGVQAGALTGSEVDTKQYFKVISSIQSKFEPYVRSLIDFIIASGQAGVTWAKTLREYEVSWLGGFQPTEKEQSDTESVDQDVLVKKMQYMTVNEVREEQGLKKIGSEGDVVLSLKKSESPFGQPSNNPNS